MTIRSAALRSTVTCLAAAAAAPLAAQTSTSQPEIQACYDSRTSSTGTPLGSGIVYRIKVPGVVGQQGCVDPKHTPFSWTIQHGALTGLGNDDHPQYLLANGTRPLAGNFGAGGFRITGLGAGTVAGDAVRFDQVVKTGDAAGGDLSGTYPNPSVAQLQGRAVTNAAPSSGQVLSWTGTAWAPATPSSGASGAAGGDLAGLYPNPRIARLLGGSVPPTADPFPYPPPNGSVLAFDNGAWGARLIGGDVSGSISGLAVVSLQGRALNAFGFLPGQVLTWNGSVWSPALPSGVTQADFNAYKSLLQSPGTLNDPNNPVDYTRLKNIPASAGTSVNTPNTLVQRDATGGFAAGAVTAASFVGDGFGLTRLNASQIDAGVLANSRLSTAVVVRDPDGGVAVNRVQFGDGTVQSTAAQPVIPGYEIVVAGGTAPGGLIGTITGVTATCPSGKRPLGGGGDFGGSTVPGGQVIPGPGPVQVWIASSTPSPSDGPPSGWTVDFGNATETSLRVTVFAICAAV